MKGLTILQVFKKTKRIFKLTKEVKTKVLKKTIMIVRKVIFNLLMLCFVNAFAQDMSTFEYPFRQENLIPWSIVAFDSQERSPAERVKMVKDLGFSQYAFGGREKHIKTMEQELRLAKKEHIKISAVWLYLNPAKDAPGQLKTMSENIFKTLEKVGLQTEIWVGFAPNYFVNLTQEEALKKAVEMIAYLSNRAQKINCKIALYNHGGWPGNPVNQLKIIKALAQYEIGIIYNFHHAHLDLEAYNENLNLMRPYLWCVNLNGMRKDGPKILSIGKGDLEKEMIQSVLNTGYKGPFGILGHVKGGDPAIILKENVEGLHTLFPND
ncbi:MAG: AP endonuclease [Flavobacteriaceae bacterium]|nr:MAG: AP endonuclease [Flavobacteriaceae bacterium]